MQISLLDSPNRLQQLITTELMDDINKKYDRETIHFASMELLNKGIGK
ncbi:MAG: hypothetical protein ABFD61_02005 [Chloroherpetonaceae bacterium]|nr:hypothetical protein [bacterium]